MDDVAIKIAVVEDNDWYRRLLVHTLELNPSHTVQAFENATELLKNIDPETGIVSIDYRLPDVEGDELLKTIKQKLPHAYIIVVSEQEDIETAVELLKAGAHDYLVKSESLKNRLLHSVELIKKQKTLQDRVEVLETEVQSKFDYSSSMVGESEQIQQVHKLLKKAIKTDINVIITGETGTGKEVVAKTIHYNSPKSKGPFVAVNIAAIPSELIESELFGHVKGAFTGAQNNRIGTFEQAQNGTLLLDEIGEMELSLQAKLLRVLQEREFTKVGASKSQSLNCRILVATNRNLVDEVKEGRFREDLYYRLYGITVLLPPLRDRGKDILLLSEKFITDYCKTQSIGKKDLSKKAKQKLMKYDFPGNIRELKSVVELAVALCESDIIEEDDIHFPEIPLESTLLNGTMTMRQYERMILQHYLNKHDNDVQQVSKILDIGKSTIYRMLKEDE